MQDYHSEVIVNACYVLANNCIMRIEPNPFLQDGDGFFELASFF
jgi:hypothetical protein